MKIGLDQFPKTPVKHWTAEANAVLEEALRTGYLPDGRIATQQRLADALGFCRLTIFNKLAGRQLPRAREINAEAGRRGGLECYRRRLLRLETIRLHTRR